MMKRSGLFITGLIIAGCCSGCMRLTEIQPEFGPPGTAVYVKCEGMFGDPSQQSLKWDCKTLCDPFSGAFTVPAADQGAEPGKHKVTLVDNLYGNEAFLIFPIFRIRQDIATFTVTAR
jgi:hypothetical protein